MKRLGLHIHFLFALALATCAVVNSRGLEIVESGFRWGTSAITKNEHVQQYEVYDAASMREIWAPANWHGTLRLNIAAGTLWGGGFVGFIGSLGPGIHIEHSAGRFSVDTGSSVAFLSEEQFGKLNLGKGLQFISHIGTKLRVYQNIQIGYRFQHMSNAGLDERNPGINLHMFEISRTF